MMLPFVAAVRDCAALLRMGQSTVFLDDKDPDLPWDLAESVIPGGMSRNGMCISCWVTAKHPSGLTFRWSIDIEGREANGSSLYQIDVDHCRRITGLLPLKPRREFGAYLEECAAAVEKRAGEFLRHAQHQLRMCGDLKQIAFGANDIQEAAPAAEERGN